MLGRAAVYLFFVLSGFWIHRMWLERYSRLEFGYPVFIASRYMRLMPVMVLATLCALAVNFLILARSSALFAHDGLEHNIFSHLFFIGYAALESPRLIEPVWSLDLEVQFYLIAPLLIALLAKSGSRIFVALTVCAVIAAWFYPLGGLAKLLCWFAVGMLAAAKNWQPSGRFVNATAAVAAVGLLMVACTGLNPILVDNAYYGENTLLNWSLAALLAPLAISSCFGNDSKRDRFFGDMSYTVYLMHWPLVVWIGSALPDFGRLDLLLALTVILLGSALICYYYDRPLQIIRSRWVARRALKGAPRGARLEHA